MSAAAPLPDGGRFGRFEVLLAERRLQVDGQSVPLGSRAFDLLAALVTRRDRVVPKNELIDVVWPGLVVEDNNLQVQISALRKVLGAQAIATVPGRGYQFTLAAAQAAGPADTSRARPPERAATSGLRKSRLLVADDNKVNRLLLCRSLELMGHDVAHADNGRVALQMLRAGRFDLLLLDLEMPELDGFGLLERRSNDAALHEVPVIVTSSLEGVTQIVRCLELGADDFLHKPVNSILLKARVESSLERKHLRDRERELLARLAPGLADTAQPAGATQEARRLEATLLVARLRDVEPAARQPAAETLELLSSWTTLMLDAIEARGGHVCQVTGDGLSAVFGALEPAGGDGEAPWAAIQAALEMRTLTALFNVERTAAGNPAIVVGTGLATGEVLAGYMRTPQRTTFVCVGAAVQRAVRLEARAAPRVGAILLDDATQAALAGRVACAAADDAAEEPAYMLGAS